MAALCLAAPALASKPTEFKGELATGGRVSFELKRSPTGERKVLHWTWRNLRVQCADGKHVVSGYFKRPWPVLIDKTFEQRATLDQDGRQGFAEVSGAFVPNSWRRANGTFQVSGDTSMYDDCESTQVKWTAHRVRAS